MRSSLLFFVLLVPAVTLADVTTLTVNDGASASFSGLDCGNSLRVAWTVTQIQSPQPCSDMTIWATESSTCATGPSGNDKEIATVSPSSMIANPSGSAIVKNTELPGQSGADAGFTCGSEVQKTWKICAYHQTPTFTGITSSCSSPGTSTANANVTYDGQPPAAPSITAVSPLSQGLRVTASLPDDAFTVRIGHRVLGSGSDYQFTTDVTSATNAVTIDVNGLQNEVVYELVAEALDEAGNLSAPSDPVQATPTQSYGFWDNYRNQGGSEPGGCTVADDSKFPLWAMLGIVAGALALFSRRMRS